MTKPADRLKEERLKLAKANLSDSLDIEVKKLQDKVAFVFTSKRLEHLTDEKILHMLRLATEIGRGLEDDGYEVHY